MKSILYALPLLLSAAVFAAEDCYKAAIYTGFAAYCDDGLSAHSACWDAAGFLLGNSSFKFELTFLNRDEVLNTDLTQFDLFVQPGGGDETTSYDDVWADVKSLSSKIRSYVSHGGRFIGFCQGGYLAGNFNSTPAVEGYNMLPADILVDEEIVQKGAATKSMNDITLQVDYTFANGKTQRKWVFFQDGTTLIDTNYPDGCSSHLQVLGTYSTDQDCAIGMVAFGEGIVGVSGPHIEADRSFWDADGFTNPDNRKDPTNGYLLGKDFLAEVMSATPSSIRSNAIKGCGGSS